VSGSVFDDKIEENFGDFSELEKLDPETAAKLHPNDTRKIQRSLKVRLFLFFITAHSLSYFSKLTTNLILL
jgi:tRNA A37 N6-isopentenylltransferase MiaA